MPRQTPKVGSDSIPNSNRLDLHNSGWVDRSQGDQDKSCLLSAMCPKGALTATSSSRYESGSVRRGIHRLEHCLKFFGLCERRHAKTEVFHLAKSRRIGRRQEHICVWRTVMSLPSNRLQHDRCGANTKVASIRCEYFGTLSQERSLRNDGTWRRCWNDAVVVGRENCDRATDGTES